jgi:hypothetical protein
MDELEKYIQDVSAPIAIHDQPSIDLYHTLDHETHCNHWWDGDECCNRKAPAMSNKENGCE